MTFKISKCQLSHLQESWLWSHLGAHRVNRDSFAHRDNLCFWFLPPHLPSDLCGFVLLRTLSRRSRNIEGEEGKGKEEKEKGRRRRKREGGEGAIHIRKESIK